jgi:lipoteichoic acid synthase
MGIITSLKGKGSKIAYWIFFIISFVLFLTNCIYYSMTSLVFGFNLLELRDEGSSYILDTILNTNPLIYVFAIALIVIGIITGKKLPVNDKYKPKRFLKVFVFFLVLHTLTPFLLGHANNNLKWNNFKNARNIYNNFSDCNKSLKISGLYEYSVRNFYFTFLKPEEEISDEDQKFLDSIYKAEDTKEENAYTGKFKGKNLIFLQLEGMDTWMLTKKTTPNLYNLRKHSIDFSNHYSIYTGGGSTFNSEFAVNTGFTTPISYIENVYSFSKNTFPYTMARLFKEQNYSVNAFHMNKGEFYSRDINYKSWGYDNYYGLQDIQKYNDERYVLDRELILNKTFYNKIFKQQGNFVNYIITYSPHTPFTTEKEVGKILAEEKYGKGNVPKLSEEDCAKMAASETDNMVGLLIQALKDNGLYDNTVIVAYADHYLYTLDDKSILDKYKETSNNLINHTPFFIWSSDLGQLTSISKVNMQMDILPTVLNLFGIDYNSNNYIGHDILSNDFKGYAFFSDYSWYDGKVYVENQQITNGKKMSKDKLDTMNNLISNVIKKNDLTLKYDYFKSK